MTHPVETSLSTREVLDKAWEDFNLWLRDATPLINRLPLSPSDRLLLRLPVRILEEMAELIQP